VIVWHQKRKQTRAPSEQVDDTGRLIQWAEKRQGCLVPATFNNALASKQSICDSVVLEHIKANFKMILEDPRLIQHSTTEKEPSFLAERRKNDIERRLNQELDQYYVPKNRLWSYPTLLSTCKSEST
jgi:hypothetical protein